MIEACEKVGRDPATFHTSTQALVFLTDDQGMIDAVSAGDWADRTIAGPADHLLERIGDYAAAGFDELIIPDFTFGNEPAQILDAVDRFQAEVIDQLD